MNFFVFGWLICTCKKFLSIYPVARKDIRMRKPSFPAKLATLESYQDTITPQDFLFSACIRHLEKKQLLMTRQCTCTQNMNASTSKNLREIFRRNTIQQKFYKWSTEIGCIWSILWALCVQQSFEIGDGCRYRRH